MCVCACHKRTASAYIVMQKNLPKWYAAKCRYAKTALCSQDLNPQRISHAPRRHRWGVLSRTGPAGLRERGPDPSIESGSCAVAHQVVFPGASAQLIRERYSARPDRPLRPSRASSLTCHTPHTNHIRHTTRSHTHKNTHTYTITGHGDTAERFGEQKYTSTEYVRRPLNL